MVPTLQEMKTETAYLWLLELGTEKFLFDRRLPNRQLEQHFRSTTSPAIYNEFYKRRLKQARWQQIEKVSI